jgi:hypothetical protein
MTLSTLTKASSEEFQFKAENACAENKKLNPAVWITSPVMNLLLTRAKKDISEATKTASGVPRFSGYSRMTIANLYTQTGARSPTGELTGVAYIVRVMSRCIVDTTHLFQNCLEAFQTIDCWGATIKDVRGMHTKVSQTQEHCVNTMRYEMDPYPATQITKSLNSKIQGKLFNTNFLRTLMANRNGCRL